MSVNRLKKLWMQAVIKKNQSDILKLYCNNALFKGTMMDEPAKGKEEIKNYFKNFSPIVNDIHFQKKSFSVRNGDLINEFGIYKFKTTKGTIEANYSFVFQRKDKEVKILSHFSSLIS